MFLEQDSLQLQQRATAAGVPVELEPEEASDQVGAYCPRDVEVSAEPGERRVV